MAKRGKARRAGGPAPRARRAPAEQVAGTLADAIAALGTALAAVDRYDADLDVVPRLDLHELASALVHAHDDLAEHHDQFLAAGQLAHTDAPLAARTFHGQLWAGMQTPRHVLALARQASDAAETVTYADRAHDEDTAAAIDPACPVAGCAGQRVRRADGTRAATCWPHLDAAAKQQIRDERDAAQLERPCPTCHALPGAACVDHDGEPTSIHSRRLHTGAG